MPFNGVYGTGLTASSNPLPSSFAVPSPYANASDAANRIFSSAWMNASPNHKAFRFNDHYARVINPPDYKIWFEAIPSTPTATFTIVLWRYDYKANAWVQPSSSPSVTSPGGSLFDFIYDPSGDPLYLQISVISTGTLSIYYENTNAGVF